MVQALVILSKFKRGGPHGERVNVLDCSFEEIEFEFQSLFMFTYGVILFGKV